MIKVKIKNFDKVARAYQRAPEIVSREIAKALSLAGLFTVKEVKKHITVGTSMWQPPIDTGALRRGIQAVFSPDKIRITPSSSTPYAWYVHEGTYKMKARPFFEITKDKSEDKVQKFFENRLEAAVNEIAKISR